ncbi:MAG: hypothetical protein Fur0041_03090 [Bacteroidia bacterium]
MKNLFQFIKSKTFLINLGIAVVAGFMLLWGIFAWMDSYTRHDEFVEVPDFVNLKIGQLDRFIEDKNVTYQIIDSIWDPASPKGIVLRQDPDPKAKVKDGRTVYLYVTSVQPPKVAMPKLEDLSERIALSVCESYGLKATVKEIDDPHKGAVIEQRYMGKRIEPGTMILKGETINLFVGKGAENSEAHILVPNLVGLTVKQARGRLMDLKLEWLLIADPGIKDTSNAWVYEQNPPYAPDRRMVPGSTIDLKITLDKSKLNADSIR